MVLVRMLMEGTNGRCMACVAERPSAWPDGAHALSTLYARVACLQHTTCLLGVTLLQRTLVM